jgi:hypothetical protein
VGQSCEGTAAVASTSTAHRVHPGGSGIGIRGVLWRGSGIANSGETDLGRDGMASSAFAFTGAARQVGRSRLGAIHAA